MRRTKMPQQMATKPGESVKTPERVSLKVAHVLAGPSFTLLHFSITADLPDNADLPDKLPLCGTSGPPLQSEAIRLIAGDVKINMPPEQADILLIGATVYERKVDNCLRGRGNFLDISHVLVAWAALLDITEIGPAYRKVIDDQMEMQ